MRQLSLAAILLAVAACSTPAKKPEAATSSAPANLRPPAEMSHGEAPIGAVSSKADRAADAPPRSKLHLHKIRMKTVAVRHEVTPGVIYDAWTFDSIVPGPTMRATVGDTIE